MLILISIIYAIFFSKYFLSKNIKVIANEAGDPLIQAQIPEKINSALNQNLPLLNTNNLEEKINSAFPSINNVQVSKDYPNTIVVKYEEFPLISNLALKTPNINKSYILNSMGFAVKEDLKKNTLPLITMYQDNPINKDEAVIDAHKLKYILDAVLHFEDKFSLNITEITYKKTARELHLRTEKDFVIWIDTQQSYDAQFKKLKKALIKLDIYSEALEYIDLRIAGGSGDKIIYKRK
ncbi:FtsQ-type POTRA domain-containing protein [Candidatus Gracilibacteria bacterium]|nr:FtsQ-type POTRA domain-containing protein [Candidatus Gracilibacteria bacterium]